MSTFAQTSTGDLALTNGSLTVEKDDAKAAAYLLFNKLRLFLGEWFLDTRIGMPYFQRLYVKNPDLKVLRQIFRKALLSTAPIVDVQQLDLSLDTGSRALTLTFRALTDDGQVITGGEGVPFILENGQ